VIKIQTARRKQKAPKARLKEIGGTGHFLMLEKPVEVVSEIRGFLEETGL